MMNADKWNLRYPDVKGANMGPHKMLRPKNPLSHPGLSAVRMANLHGLPPSTGLAYLWKVEKVDGATPNRWRFVRGP